ncbi:protein PHLOEM PROTEIN 2-LIKE A1-like [Elaeis guineensis]|uniref:Uncharacterized protein PHLOEM PROTEIN 2-LIKE A4 n=1 Tax=Elaeis guineensis var. tenera TaxID=51953 RepID=A0A6I9SL59_ELAGV|nr:uncharacterized protein PHLOEM PROTEIN 2-LIKE A4 [Elaeis guineensis]
MAAEAPKELLSKLSGLEDGVLGRYWKKRDSSCIDHLVLYPRALEIAGGDDPTIWRWFWSGIRLPFDVEFAELKVGTYQLGVKGMLRMDQFTPGRNYNITFWLRMKDPAGFQPVVTVTLELPHSQPIVNHVPLIPGPGGWVKLNAGGFPAGGDGEIKFSLTNDDGIDWKKGLTVAAVFASIA